MKNFKSIVLSKVVHNELIVENAYFARDEVLLNANQKAGQRVPAKSLGDTLDKALKNFEKLNNKRKSLGLLPLAMILPLSACGGGSESQPEVTGRAIDGYLGGSKVFLDSNPDVFVLTSSEAGQQGLFSGLFGTGAIVVQGGIDTSTGKAFTGELRAPEGSKVITPLTTIVEAVVRKAVESGGEPVSVEEAAQSIATGLGLGDATDLLNTDFIAEDAGGQAKAAAQVASVLSLVTAAGGTGAAASAIEKVAEKIQVAATTGVKSTVLTDSAQLGEVLTAVANEGKFEPAPGGNPDAAPVDIFAVVNNIAAVVEVVNSRIEVATSVKDILATQAAVQEDFVEQISSGVVIDVAVIDAIVEESIAEIDAYFEELAEAGFDTGIDIDAELILDDVNFEIPDEILEEILEETGGGGGGGGGSKDPALTDVPLEGILNFDTGVEYTAAQFQLAIDEATAGDTLILGSGRYNVDVKIEKSLKILGANFDQAINENDGFLDVNGDVDTSGILFDTEDGLRANDETWIDGSITVAADNVELNGLRLHSYNGALRFRDDDIDNFTLKHSYVTGFEASEAIAYEHNYFGGQPEGEASTGWVISGNLIGGIAGGVGGSMYLDGLSDSSISDNIFWRPAAAHIYADNLTNVEFNDNFFYHGLHAGGANEDGLLSVLANMDNNYGYVGFNGGQDGYGYGFGYGYGYGEASSKAGYGGYGYGYGQGYGYGYGGQGDWSEFMGRNYWIELKEGADYVKFEGNVGQYNSGGIQFWDEGDASVVFSNIGIIDNTFADFINADPGGALINSATRHKSGLVSGLVWETHEDSASSNLLISGNEIIGSIGEIYNYNPDKPRDLVSLIDIKGGLSGLLIDNNDLAWYGSLPGSSQNASNVLTQGIHLAGNISDFVFIMGNDYDTDTPAGYSSVALAINAGDYTGSFGRLDDSNFEYKTDPLTEFAFVGEGLPAEIQAFPDGFMTSAEIAALFGTTTSTEGFYIVGDTAAAGSYSTTTGGLESIFDDTTGGKTTGIDIGEFPYYAVFSDGGIASIITMYGVIDDNDINGPTVFGIESSDDSGVSNDSATSEDTPTIEFSAEELISSAALVKLDGTDSGAAMPLALTFVELGVNGYTYTADIDTTEIVEGNPTYLTDGLWGIRLVDAAGNIFDAELPQGFSMDPGVTLATDAPGVIYIDTDADVDDDLSVGIGAQSGGEWFAGGTTKATTAITLSGIDNDVMSIQIVVSGTGISQIREAYAVDSNGDFYLDANENGVVDTGETTAIDFGNFTRTLDLSSIPEAEYKATVTVEDFVGNRVSGSSTFDFDGTADSDSNLALSITDGGDQLLLKQESKATEIQIQGLDDDVDTVDIYSMTGSAFLTALKDGTDTAIYAAADIDTLSEIETELAKWSIDSHSNGVLTLTANASPTADNPQTTATFALNTVGVLAVADAAVSGSGASSADTVDIDLSTLATAADVPVKVIAMVEDALGNTAWVDEAHSASGDIVSVSNVDGTVSEGASNGTTVLTYDFGNAGGATLTDDAGGLFAMDASGVITIANSLLLDYETNSSYTIQATPSGGSAENLTILVTDLANEPYSIVATDVTGNDVTFEVMLDSSYDVAAALSNFGVTVTYDPSIMTYKADSFVSIFESDGKSNLKLANASDTDSDGNADLLTMSDSTFSGTTDYDLANDPIATFVMTFANFDVTEVGFGSDTSNTTVQFQGESLQSLTVDLSTIVDFSGLLIA